jgi:uncharacterized protein (TIRG00374 family)
MFKTIMRILVNTLIGGVLIYFWFKLVNVSEILHALESFNPWILIPVAFFFVLSSILKAIRFKVLLSKEIKVPALKLINLTFLSQLLSFTIPVRAGEIAKGVYLSTEYKLHFGKAVVWVFLDRFLDFWAVLTLSLLFLLIIPTNLPKDLTTTLFFAVAVASVMVVLVVLRPGYFRAIAGILSKLFIIKTLKEKFLKFSFFVIECVSLLKGGLRRNLGLLLLTVTAAFSEAICWYIILSAFISGLPIIKVWLGSMLNALTFLIPAAPGYVGSAEAAGLAVFTYGLGLNGTFVSASTVIFHALSLVAILATGIYGLYALKFNLGLVWNKLFKKDSK